uniref:Uncharacterized protein n=1 Tax=Fagus sylvatica TaxID=28930 RepID=A0A2N9IIY8_FAGSY
MSVATGISLIRHPTSHFTHHQKFLMLKPRAHAPPRANQHRHAPPHAHTCASRALLFVLIRATSALVRQ